MTPAEICHYYSSSDEEPTPMPEHKQPGGYRVQVTMQPLFKEMEAQEESDDSDVAITKEVRTGSTGTMKSMAQFAKRRPGLHRTSWRVVSF